MAQNQGPPNGDWEENIRRMILQGQTRSSLFPDQDNQSPVVRLPPTAQASSPHNRPPQQHVSHNVSHGPSHHNSPRDSLQSHANHHSGPPNAHGLQGRGLYNPNNPINRHQPIDPNIFTGHGRGRGYADPSTQSRGLYDANRHRPDVPDAFHNNERKDRQAQYLEQKARSEVPLVEMSQDERDEKMTFRVRVERIIHDICNAHPDRIPKVSLQCFGSFQSGFASKGSDMDLVIVLQDGSAAACFALDEHDLPRALEKKLLELGFGARLLTRTRVPILKLCEKPNDVLLENLRAERQRWDSLSHQEKYPHLFPPSSKEEEAEQTGAPTSQNGTQAETSLDSELQKLTLSSKDGQPRSKTHSKPQQRPSTIDADRENSKGAEDQSKAPREWTRERKSGPLDFPSEGVGIQSDINFFNPLGLHNTQLLRCYSLCDPRVRPMVLFVKSWAKRRQINSSYSGTLSSYGYVLMVLHYLMNVATPGVIPNLQGAWRPGPEYAPPGASATSVDGWDVDFWRDEEQILNAVRAGKMTPNQQSLGALLAGFFNYYSSQGDEAVFHWMHECLSLRSPGGLMSKEQKGWIKAVTEEGEGKRVQHRYLFCIEDPFELTHNVARTVTHNGIVAIRDEFRRARRILLAVGAGYAQPRDGELFAAITEEEAQKRAPPPRRDHQERNGQRTDDTRTRRVAPPGTQQHNDRFGPTTRPHTAVQPNDPQAPATNVRYDEAFPSLAAPSISSHGRPAHGKRNSGVKTRNDNDTNFSEVSGDRAKALVEEVRRKKMLQHAANTALGAAESVLDGID